MNSAQMAQQLNNSGDRTDNKQNFSSRLAPFLLGLLCCNNLIYGFKVGATPINIGMLFSVVIIFFCFFSRKRSIEIKSKKLRNWIAGFFCCVIFSVVPMLIYMNNSIYQMRYVYGLMGLFGYTSITIATMLLYKWKSSIYKGMLCGIIINMLVSIIAYFQWQRGAMIPIYNMILRIFPQDSVATHSWKFRAMGLFQESSYYIGFLIASMFLMVGELKTSFSKELLIVSVSLFVIFSGSGNIVVYLISILAYMVLSYRAGGRKLIVRVNTASAINHLFFYTAVLTLLLIFNGLDPIVNGFRSSLQGASLSDSVQRWDNIKHSLSLIPEIPLGVGWNMLRSYNTVYHANRVASLGVYSAGSSSFLLQLLLEIGLFGTLCYIMSILTCYKTLVRKTATSNTIGVAVSLLVIFLLQVLNGVSFFPYFMLIIGLAICGGNNTDEQNGV